MAKTIKNGFVDENTSFPINIWVPATNKRVRIYTITGTIINRTANDVFLKMQVKLGGSLKDLAVIGVRGQSFENIIISIPHDFDTDTGNGTEPVLKMLELAASDSTDWDGFFAVVGEEI